MENSLSVRNLRVSYYGIQALDDISFSTESGKLIGIIGPNGAGKSTLMKAILGLISKDAGEVSFNDMTLKQIRKNIAYVPQRAVIDWDFPITVLDTVLLGTYPSLGFFHRPKKSDKELAYNCLEKVGMQEFSKRQIGELSGGQQQRIFLARALAQKADLFFLDEPFVGIDVSSEEVIIRILKELRDDGKTVFVVHHDLSKVTDYFDDLILMNKELIKFGPVKQVLQPELMKKAYNAQFSLLDSMGVII
ncbi:metal ABC transporter ATP-binding protein [Filibacter tadaridae]|uniref:High-affinity zinc uptake system ATP-binding protein ZnuC n=1 Tax=Filibacter tadaridae TaxID=2483811 RepID=A0A3P5WNB1_9BACL|nr:metal ABC transporter ATP-binding protein [Filibacter tadaridae]VDC21021.1 High-affinity zinc uptake system ATP-binding protein ZnuC [Filibacter tadaridae]